MTTFGPDHMGPPSDGPSVHHTRMYLYRVQYEFMSPYFEGTATGSTVLWARDPSHVRRLLHEYFGPGIDILSVELKAA
jgi:hypothetical protein